jgi:hypothetical protein
LIDIFNIRLLQIFIFFSIIRGHVRKVIEKGAEAQNEIHIPEEAICASCPPCVGSETGCDCVTTYYYYGSIKKRTYYGRRLGAVTVV